MSYFRAVLSQKAFCYDFAHLQTFFIRYLVVLQNQIMKYDMKNIFNNENLSLKSYQIQPIKFPGEYHQSKLGTV